MAKLETQTDFSKEQFIHLEKDQTDIKIDIAVIKQTMTTKSDIANMATKNDLMELKTELKTDISELRVELKTEIAEVKGDIKWGMRFLGTITALLIALVIGLFTPFIKNAWIGVI